MTRRDQADQALIHAAADGNPGPPNSYQRLAWLSIHAGSKRREQLRTRLFPGTRPTTASICAAARKTCRVRKAVALMETDRESA